MACRLEKALRNPLETFAAALLAAQLTGTHRGLTGWGARLYFSGGASSTCRCNTAWYPLTRSLEWNAGTLGIGTIFFALLSR